MAAPLDELIEQLRELSEEDQAAAVSVFYAYLSDEDRQGVQPDTEE